MTCRIAVLISGNGSNLQALIDSCDSAGSSGLSGLADSEIVCVLSNKQSAYGLERARQAGIPAHWVDPTLYSARADYDQALLARLAHYQPDMVILAGYMRILSPGFIQRFEGRMLNIHPSLLPEFPGLNTHQRVLDAGKTEHGCSVHFVTEELDAGPVVIQARIPVLPDDTADSLAERIHPQEHRIYPQAAAWLASGRLLLSNGKAILDGQQLADSGYSATQ